METKKCKKCKEVKPVTEYYIQLRNKDGLFCNCKGCEKTRSREYLNKKRQDPQWVNDERRRTREKYHRYKYTTVYTFPEKHRANVKVTNIKVADGNERHHWSYNNEHHRDIIELNSADHHRIHAWMIYDQERMMYRRITNMMLLDSKKEHEKYIHWVLKNKY